MSIEHTIPNCSLSNYKIAGSFYEPTFGIDGMRGRTFNIGVLNFQQIQPLDAIITFRPRVNNPQNLQMCIFKYTKATA